MEAYALEFALIGATIVGTVIAVLVGRALDRSGKEKQVIGLVVPQASQVIDFSKKNILLSPPNAPSPLKKIFEQEIAIGNIGFSIVSDFSITIRTSYDKEFDTTKDFVDFSIETTPSGMRYSIGDAKNGPRETAIKVSFSFMNRGDRFILRTISSSDFTIQCDAHHPNTDFVQVDRLVPMPTLRQRIAASLGGTKYIEFSLGAVGAAVTGAALTLIG